MINKFFAGVLLPTAVALAMSGCAGKPSKTEVKTSVPAHDKANTYDGMIRKAAAEPVAAVEGTGWKSMFDGRTLKGWQVTEFGGQGPVRCESGLMVLDMGSSLTGVNWTNEVPKVDYEISLEAMRLQGSDFFCGLTFPVKDSFCSLILGGWGGAVTGISSVDGEDASENETTKFVKFEMGTWYHVRVRVTAKKIEAWVDGKQIVDLETAEHRISLRFGEIEMSKPFGLATWQTTGAIRALKIRDLTSNIQH